ncbi:hypothetical protein DMU17_06055 [Salmonella enterica]|nr:hypothetical protein [Salmonella enterica]EBK4509328.1 hypothetical protein [Salmonella enterica]
MDGGCWSGRHIRKVKGGQARPYHSAQHRRSLLFRCRGQQTDFSAEKCFRILFQSRMLQREPDVVQPLAECLRVCRGEFTAVIRHTPARKVQAMYGQKRQRMYVRNHHRAR